MPSLCVYNFFMIPHIALEMSNYDNIVTLDRFVFLMHWTMYD